MKISAAILISIANSAPGPNQEPDFLGSSERGLDDICSDFSDEVMILSQENTNNGQSGILTLNKQSGYDFLGCGQPIGQQCKSGVSIKWDMVFPTGLYHKDPPYIMKAVYFVNGELLWTERYYGERNNHSYLNLPREFDLPVDAYNVRVFIYANKTTYTLTARAKIEWECLGFDPDFPTSNIGATNTWQMANAVLTKDFKPFMAENYGCAGRGLFDGFGPTAGSVKDDIDAAFLTWKKCVKCASGENEDNIVPYWYDVSSDSCGAYIGKSKFYGNSQE